MFLQSLIYYCNSLLPAIKTYHHIYTLQINRSVTDYYIYTKSASLFWVNCIAISIHLVPMCHIGPSRLKLHFYIYELFKWFIGGPYRFVWVFCLACHVHRCFYADYAEVNVRHANVAHLLKSIYKEMPLLIWPKRSWPNKVSQWDANPTLNKHPPPTRSSP
jgi:hypothetical protein